MTGRNIYRRSYLIGLSLIVLMVISVLSLSGCSREQAGSKTGNNQATKIISDCAGRQVEVPVDPQRIACTCPEAGYALAMYGKADKIIATTDGMQRDLLLVEMYPQLKGLSVPKKGGTINIEELIKIQADLIFVKDETVNNEAEMEKLRLAKIPVVVMQFQTMDEQQYAMQMMASIVGAEEEGQKYQQFYDQKVGMVRQRVAQIPDNEKLTIYHSSQEATRTDPADSLAADWTKAAGVINVSVGQNLEYADGNHYATLEQILLWDPDYILVNDPNVVGYIMGHEQWRNLQAVKNRHVLALPNGVSRWGHPNSLETPLATIWTAKTVYPNLFTDVDMKAIVHDFYQEFFEWDLDNATIERILSSQGMRSAKS